MAPAIPELPDFPALTWKYENGCYCISESDADALLNYCENQIPQYRFQVEQYKKQLQVVFDHCAMKLDNKWIVGNIVNEGAAAMNGCLLQDTRKESRTRRLN